MSLSSMRETWFPEIVQVRVQDLFVNEAALTGETFPVENSQAQLPLGNLPWRADQCSLDGHPRGQQHGESALGLSTTIAVLLHEIPQEFADFGILIHSGLSVRKAVLLNLGSASVAILGTALSLLAGSVAQEAVTMSLVPLTAGGFVYLAAADLIPELQHDRSLRALVVQTVLITLGIVVMGLLTFVE